MPLYTSSVYSTGGGGDAPTHMAHYSHSTRTTAWCTDPRMAGTVCTKVDPFADEHPRYESFILGEDEKKVEVEPETRELSPRHPPPPQL
jgi:hypothetical protein